MNARFDEPWWRSVVAAWNDSESRGSLAGAGTIGFEVLDRPSTVWIRFGSSGQASLVPEPRSRSHVSVLSATEREWRAFVAGKFSATMGVLSGRIRHRGSVTKLMPYGLAFNNLAAVARQVGA